MSLLYRSGNRFLCNRWNSSPILMQLSNDRTRILPKAWFHFFFFKPLFQYLFVPSGMWNGGMSWLTHLGTLSHLLLCLWFKQMLLNLHQSRVLPALLFTLIQGFHVYARPALHCPASCQVEWCWLPGSVLSPERLLSFRAGKSPGRRGIRTYFFLFLVSHLDVFKPD